MDFAPFKNESDSISLGTLTVENREDHVSLYGTLAITRDRTGLVAAQNLREIFDRIIKELESEGDLPVRVASAETPVRVKNPFG